MIMPLYDDNTGRRRTPYVNYTLIAINVFVFVFFQEIGANTDFTYAFSAVPYEIMTNIDLVDDVPVVDPRTGQREVIPQRRVPAPVVLTLLTSIFMHGGL